MCLEFSKVQNPVFREIYRQYSFLVIPEMGKAITGDKDSYQYLVESIERFLSQEELKQMMEKVGFEQVSYTNMTNGIVAIHSGYKFDWCCLFILIVNFRYEPPRNQGEV